MGGIREWFLGLNRTPTLSLGRMVETAEDLQHAGFDAFGWVHGANSALGWQDGETFDGSPLSVGNAYCHGAFVYCRTGLAKPGAHRELNGEPGKSGGPNPSDPVQIYMYALMLPEDPTYHAGTHPIKVSCARTKVLHFEDFPISDRHKHAKHQKWGLA